MQKEEHQSNKKFFIPIIVILVLILGLISFLIFDKIMEKKNNKDKDTTSEVKEDTKDKTEEKPAPTLESTLASLITLGIDCSSYQFGLPKDSSVAPYQTLEGSIGTSRIEGCGDVGKDLTAMFYRVSPTAEWQFFSRIEDELPCGQYNTTDLKNAFADTKCFDQTTDELVPVSSLH